jgi:preprotein translocase subunit SecG
MESLIIFVHVLAALGITGLVLLQHGKGADAGASFGSGASQTVFGSVGSGNALTKSTSWLAIVFFATSLVLALYAKQQAGQSIQEDGLIENTSVLTETTAAQVDQDLPVLPAELPAENAATDIPQTATAESAEAPVIDEALQAALDQATALATEAAANAPATAEAEESESADAQQAPAEAPAQ